MDGYDYQDEPDLEPEPEPEPDPEPEPEPDLEPEPGDEPPDQNYEHEDEHDSDEDAPLDSYLARKRLRKQLIADLADESGLETSPLAQERHWSDPDYPADHHIFPQAQKLREHFDRTGMNIHDHTVTVTNEEHRRIHETWNKEWKWFFDDHPNASREEIENQAAEMMQVYNILDRYVHEYGLGSGSLDFEP